MESRAQVLGQPLNPIVTVLPLGILGSAVFVDLGALVSGFRVFGTLGHVDMLAGLLAGLGALCAVLVDLVTAPAGSHARHVLGFVSGAICAMIVLFGIVWSVRGNGGTPPNPALFLVELVALAVGIAGAWLARGLAVGRGLPTRTPVPAPSLAMRRTVPLSRIAR